MSKILNIGMDIGSTTIKVVVTNNRGEVLLKNYRRHYADITGSVKTVLSLLKNKLGNVPARFGITGSAGMGVAERCGIKFVQELIAACELISCKFPFVKTLVDIGGEDAKMIFFSDKHSPDIRMNGSCAGGTGSFIDQTSLLLNVETEKLNELAENATITYPIASRCGVFAKTDIQNLLSRNVSKENIAVSVLHSVSIQVITSLARGHKIEPKIFLCGGPFSFMPALRKAFTKELNVNDDDVFVTEHAAVVPAWGTALCVREQNEKPLNEYIELLACRAEGRIVDTVQHLKPLFNNDDEIKEWKKSKEKYSIASIDPLEIKGNACFIGIDCGSTTTKIAAIDEDERVFFKYYANNNGNVLETVKTGLEKLQTEIKLTGKDLCVAGSAVTGYGEDLIKAAFELDYGVVETIAHYKAAAKFNPDVSFILDIGGQDMKAIFVENGIIKRLEINEACSSGCGSFIETFARSLKYSPAAFAQAAINSKEPCDLGTRCTVFMNSKVKQALREGASIADISAGLGYSVIKNCLNKVLKLKDISQLGGSIMVQGGTFRNIAVARALEIETGKSVMIVDTPEVMGAYGAALTAKQNSIAEKACAHTFDELLRPIQLRKKAVPCKGCQNSCMVTCFTFGNGGRYYAGNKCEKIFFNGKEKPHSGQNIYLQKYNLLFNRSNKTGDKRLKIGLPRALGIYENYPFWHKLFTEAGAEVVLSDVSTMGMYEKAAGTVMSDNICFPAKLTNGHIMNLIEKKVDRIFMPFVVYEKKEDVKTTNSYNCPIVTAYSEVIKSAINPAAYYNVPLDSPSFTFRNKKLMRKNCGDYLKKILPELSNKEIIKAFEAAYNEQIKYENELTAGCKKIMDSSIKNNRTLILLTGRPYHTDPLIQHKIAEMISEFDADVISEDIVRNEEAEVENVESVMQWAYTNRILKAALWAAQNPNVQYVELTSFGCGPDAFILDEVTDILRRRGKNPTFLKIDDINNIGSTRLRIRSLIESLKLEKAHKTVKSIKCIHTKPFEKKDKKRKILIPWFADFYSPFIPAALSLSGYDAENLPPSDFESVEYGLKYSNNEICYPATLIVGDVIKALNSGKYNRKEIAFGITQTGGQCRATNYLPLLKKALIMAGYPDIPVVSVALNKKNYNYQPGFSFKWVKSIKPVITGMIYADCLSQMYFATAPREIRNGEAKRLKEKYIEAGIQVLKKNDSAKLYSLAKQAAKEFEEANNHKVLPRIGIVGEIFIKYNSFGHKNIINWLIEQKAEPVMPSLSDFFMTGFVNQTVLKEENIVERNSPKSIMRLFEGIVYSIIRKMEENVKGFTYYHPLKRPAEDASKASVIINLGAQFGEGWRIASEFAEYARRGINNVISLQPFGCIANHIISKGIEKSVREQYPFLNLLFLDFDSGTSEANVYNRLHFMLKNAEEQSAQFRQEYKSIAAV